MKTLFRKIILLTLLTTIVVMSQPMKHIAQEMSNGNARSSGKTLNLYCSIGKPITITMKSSTLIVMGNVWQNGNNTALNSENTMIQPLPDESLLPAEFTLTQNYPNPFNPTTVINYSVPVTGTVVLKIYNMLGVEVATIVNGVQDPGYKSVVWNASGMPSGIYFYKLTAGSFTDVKKLLLMK